MSSRTALLVTTVVLGAALVVLVVVLTPWRPLPLHGVDAVPRTRRSDFTAEQVAREDVYHAAVRPPAYVSLGLSLLIACVLGLSPVGARLVSRGGGARSAAGGAGRCCSAGWR